ncbi:UNVERIFIED_CONTAM: DNA (cytosine-5)-methyltransferase DRM2 [Sesamum radiatum]|uniref:DNA (cytosine-5-)-methyltransferase n=1 Tax=Sesamum radiatum TaxID=300843 RepID=A0AAW2VPF1_SESRA
MDGNASGEESVSVDWTTDDELEILAEPVTSSQPTLATCSTEAIAGDVEDNVDSVSEKHKMLLSLANTGSLSEKDKKLLALANMGYTVEEASIAMDRCGQEASVAVLTDFICAAQMAREEDCYLLEDDLKHLYNGNSTNKKRKFYEMCRKKNVIEETIRLPNPMIGFGVPSQQPEHINRSLPEVARGPPYFYYENVALAPKGVWDTISRFLYEVEPEFVDSKYFCATARKRGYVHNLPIENRFPLIPLPPLTIHQAFPLSRKWWPSWDTRDKLNCIQTAIGSAKLTERIRNALERYDGDPPETVQRFVLEQCRKWNLVWVGRNKVAPLEPDEVEMLLGFPKNHTKGRWISRTDRYKSLGNSFQVDTVAYHLSVLKDIYPNGINLLSLFSGIGGAEVALHRLGIKLKNVVSVEKSKVNRDIVKSWWEQTNQRGNLIDFDDVQQIDGERLEQIIDSIGGFDLVVGGSPCNNLAGSNRVSRDGLEGKESSLFYDYFRILDLVKCIMRSRQV